MRGYRDLSAFWYIVLQDVILKDEYDGAVRDLAPSQMILVDKLWVLGPNQVLAQVVYPAKGYVPRERSTCGQLITRLVSSGPPVPEELLDNQQFKYTVYGHQSNFYYNHKGYRISSDEHRAHSQGYRASTTVRMIPRSYSYPLWGNTIVGRRQIYPDKSNHSYPVCYCPVESPKMLLQVQAPAKYLAVNSHDSNRQHTRNPINQSRKQLNLLDPSLVVQESKIRGLGPYCGSATQRRLRNVPSATEFPSKEDSKDIERQGNNWSVKLRDEKMDVLCTTLDRRKGFVQRLLSIYNSDECFIEKEHRRDTEIVHKLENAIAADRICQTRPEDNKTDITTLCNNPKQYRWDTGRWIIVSALCHSLQVICCTNEGRETSKHLQQNMIFHSPTAADISLPAYLRRISWFLGCSSACFVLALEYVHRLAHHCPEIEVNNNSVHQILMTCIVVATKFIDDRLFKNTFYARIAGLPVTNLSAFEVKLLFFLKFDLRVLPEQYKYRYTTMVAENKGPSMVNIRPDILVGDAKEEGLMKEVPSSKLGDD